MRHYFFFLSENTPRDQTNTNTLSSPSFNGGEACGQELEEKGHPNIAMINVDSRARTDPDVLHKDLIVELLPPAALPFSFPAVPTHLLLGPSAAVCLGHGFLRHAYWGIAPPLPYTPYTSSCHANY